MDAVASTVTPPARTVNSVLMENSLQIAFQTVLWHQKGGHYVLIKGYTVI